MDPSVYRRMNSLWVVIPRLIDPGEFTHPARAQILVEFFFWSVPKLAHLRSDTVIGRVSGMDHGPWTQ